MPKSDGSFRFVLDLKRLNKFITTEHFKMEDLRTAILLLAPGDFMEKIDLESAYHSVPIHNSSTKYLRLSFQGTSFEFTCLPFVLIIAPLLFTKTMKPLVSFLRRLGYHSVVYLDDFLCFG